MDDAVFVPVRAAIFAAAYALISTQRLPGVPLSRPGASLLGAVAMVTIGRLPLAEAYAAIDLDVIVFLLGLMLVVGYLEEARFFEWFAERIVERATSPRRLLAAVVATSGFLSALFVNDTVCLVVTPLLLDVLRPLRVRPTPYLIALATAANSGSVMTATGNPQNMLIAIRGGFTFAEFLGALAPVGLGALALNYFVLSRVYRAELGRPFERPVHGPPVRVDWPLARRDPAPALARVEWPLLLFFASLFVLMRGLETTGAVAALGDAAAPYLGDDGIARGAAVSGAMLVLSNLVSNVPAVLLCWAPIVAGLPGAREVWLLLAMSATFAGNLILIGSMANLIVAERAEARGTRIGFAEFARVGVPLALASIGWGLLLLS